MSQDTVKTPNENLCDCLFHTDPWWCKKSTKKNRVSDQTWAAAADANGSSGKKSEDCKSIEIPEGADYTREQVEAVDRVKKCEDFYEILGVEKDAVDSVIKKAYHKMALQVHNWYLDFF